MPASTMKLTAKTRLYQVSNPCWYRHELLDFRQLGPETAVGRVRVLELLRVLRVRMLDGVRIDSRSVSLHQLPLARLRQRAHDPPP